MSRGEARVGGPRATHASRVLPARVAGLLLALLVSLGSAARAESAGETRYTLQPGDRLVHLAKRFEVTAEAILAANELRQAEDLRAGQEIVIPPKGWSKTPRGKARIEASRRKAASHLVRQGETLSELSARFGVGVEAILAANGMTAATELRAGQEIVIPGEGGAGSKRAAAAAAPRAPAEPGWMQRARALASSLELGSRQVASKLLHGRPEPRWVAAAGGAAAPRSLRFPVAEGVAGRGWGSGTGGYHRAFDIPGPPRARVSAAAPGIVAYAGEELAGFGKVVIVVHPGELVTVYAHNAELKTLAGEKVRAGTRIALLGSTGISRGPHVHFEVVYRGQLCDPLPLLRPVPRTAAGRPALKQAELLTWRSGPPAKLRCGPRTRHPAYVGRPRGVRIPDDEQARILAALAEEGEDAPPPDPDLTDDLPAGE